MSFTMTSTVRKVSDHFEPEAALSPQEQRALRAHLEQIDYAAFAANREILGKAVGHIDIARIQRMAVAAAQARGRWVAASLALSQAADAPGEADVNKVAALRHAYEELTEGYNAVRRMVERGYLHYNSKA